MKLQMKYKCEYCNKEYKRKDFYLKHIETCKSKPKITQHNEDELYLIKFYTNFNRNVITATPHQLNRLFDIFKNIHNESAGNRGCEGVQKYVIINLYSYWNKHINKK